MAKRNKIILIVSLIIAAISICAFITIIVYTQFILEPAYTADYEIESISKQETETESKTPEKYHKYDEEEKKHLDEVYPIDNDKLSDEQKEDFYQKRYEKAVKVLNNYPDQGFKIEEVIEELTPVKHKGNRILSTEMATIGLDENSNKSLGLIEYFITTVQPESMPQTDDPIERASILYGDNFDTSKNLIDVTKYEWIQLTAADYENLLQVDISSRPVIFNSYGNSCKYADQNNTELQEILRDSEDS